MTQLVLFCEVMLNVGRSGHESFNFLIQKSLVGMALVIPFCDRQVVQRN